MTDTNDTGNTPAFPVAGSSGMKRPAPIAPNRQPVTRQPVHPRATTSGKVAAPKKPASGGPDGKTAAALSAFAKKGARRATPLPSSAAKPAQGAKPSTGAPKQSAATPGKRGDQKPADSFASKAKTAQSNAKAAFDEAQSRKQRTPEQKSADRKEAAVGLLKDVAGEAARGAAKASVIPGAGTAIGAVKGAASGLMKNRTVRKWVPILLGVIVVPAVIIPMYMHTTALMSVAIMLGGDAAVSNQSAVSSGKSVADINQATDDAVQHDVPWPLILAAQSVLGEADPKKLAHELTAEDPSGRESPLSAGTVYDGDDEVRRVGDSKAEKEAAETAKTITITALKNYGATDAQAKQVYDLAFKWTMGQGLSCTADVGGGTAGEQAGTVNLSDEQLANAMAILGVTKTIFPVEDQERAATIALATALQESGLKNIDYGDSVGPDSRGMFQQRDSWGSLELRLNPAGSTALFYRKLVTVPGWQEMTLGDAALKVQVFYEPYKHHYDAKEQWAKDFIAQNMAAATPIPVPAEVGAINAGENINTPTVTSCRSGASGEWTSPIALDAPGFQFNSFYGWRDASQTGYEYLHNGVDLGGRRGENILAASSGTVIWAVTNITCEGCAGYGNTVVIDHGNGSITRYNHLQSGEVVKVGDQVETGQVVGHLGNTGKSNGAHLHFCTFEASAIVYGGQNEDTAVDPVWFLIDRGVDLRHLPIMPGSSTKPTF